MINLLLILVGYLVAAFITSVIAVKWVDDLGGEDAVILGIIWPFTVLGVLSFYCTYLVFDSWVDFLKRLK